MYDEFDMKIFLILFALLVASGCKCSEDHEYLTLGISSTPDPEVTAGITTPKWNQTLPILPTHYLVASANYGPEDREPTDEVFELYDTTEEPPVQLEYVPRKCEEFDEMPIGTCASNAGSDTCNSLSKDFVQTAPFEEGRTYALVHRIGTGNGEKLSWDGERQEFAGAESLVMNIEILEVEQ